ncbi:MAG: BamA/TamA family outer membrane protein [Bacteroidia bacterium]
MSLPKSILCLCLFFLIAGKSKAGIIPSDSSKKEGVAVMPLFYYTPDTRFALGAAGVYYFRANSTREGVPEPRLSYIQLLGDYTQNEQLDVWALWSVFTNNEDYLLRGELRFRNFPDRFYGVGNATNEDQMERYYYDLFSFKALFMRKFGRYFFAGFDYQLRNEFNFGYFDNKELIQGTLPGYAGGIGSALGLVASYDSRDNVINAFQGQFFEFSSYFYNSNLGGTFNFFNLNAEYNTYRELKPGWVLASNARLVLNYGEVPFLNMARAGGEDLLRGYAANRFRDHHFIGGQMELRLPLYKRLGGVAFAGMGDVFRQADDLALDRIKYSVGTGLRYALNRSERLNVRLDYGWGRGTGSFYFSVTEAF